MASTKKLRILCFGDSLSAGWRIGFERQPYAIALAKTVTAAAPEYDVATVVDGQPGDLVTKTGRFLRRMERHFVSGEQFDWTIVLGGTNDLAYNGKPDAIFADLLRVYQIPLSHGSKVLALTVPETGTKTEWLNHNRKDLNNLIKGHRAKDFHVYDFHEAFPYWALSAELRERYWNDTVHLTADGYDFMGEKVAEALVGLLASERAETD